MRNFKGQIRNLRRKLHKESICISMYFAEKETLWFIVSSQVFCFAAILNFEDPCNDGKWEQNFFGATGHLCIPPRVTMPIFKQKFQLIRKLWIFVRQKLIFANNAPGHSSRFGISRLFPYVLLIEQKNILSGTDLIMKITVKDKLLTEK